MVIEFYLQYDRDTHKAKLVYWTDPAAQVTLYIDKIISSVPIETHRQDVSPLFVVKGYCKCIKEENGIIYIS